MEQNQCPHCTFAGNPAGVQNCTVCHSALPQKVPPSYDQPPLSYNPQVQQPIYAQPAGYGGTQGYSPQPEAQYAPQQPQQNYGGGQVQQPVPQQHGGHLTAPKDFEGEHLAKGQEIDYSRPGYNDVFWGAFFILHCIGIIAVLVAFRDKLDFSGSSRSRVSDRNDIKTVLYISLTAVGIGFASAWTWVALMKRYAGQMIKATFGLVVVFNILFALSIFLAGSPIGALFAIIFLGLFLLWAFWIRSRIPLATVMLKVSAKILTKHYQPIYVAFFMIFVSTLWTVVWALATIALFEGTEHGGGLVFVMVLSYYWSSNVAMNLILVTAAGVAATWFSSPGAPSPTKNSFIRASTTSFGSICFGSFIIAVVQALKFMVNQARNNQDGNAFVLCLVDCLLSCLETVIEYVNTFAFARVAIYGIPYWQAAKETWQLFRARGFDVLANDDLTGWVLGLGALLGGILAAVVGGFWANRSAKVQDWVVVGGLSFVIAFFIMFIVFFVIRAFVVTFFVASAEDPEVLRTNHPKIYKKFTKALSKIYGNQFDRHFGGHQGARI
eukprot:1062246_1